MNPTTRGKAYWRSLDDLADKPEFRAFVEREFPAFADEMLAPGSRRNFLKLMGASMALAGFTACRWPSEEILPFTARPDGFVPGVPELYATSMELGGISTGLLVRSYDGRPIKIEGNPEHPSSLGAASAVAQASLLELYDPERSRAWKHRGPDGLAESDAAAFAAFVRDHFGTLAGARGRGFRVLAEASASPSLTDMRQRLLGRFPEARWYEYEPTTRDNEREGARMAFGRPLRTHLVLDQAEVIVSFDEDFLVRHPAAVRYARDYADGRRPESGFDSRLYAFEATYSPTGTMADHRVPMLSRMVPVAAACLAAELFIEQKLPLPASSPELIRVFERFQFHPMYTELDWTFARQLTTRRGRSLIVAGPDQPPEVHALVHLMNEGLGNVGRTVFYTEEPTPDRPTHVAAITQLAQEMRDGNVETLLVLGGNPAFDAPAELGFTAALGNVPTTIRLGAYEDETSHESTWHVPRAHWLETWGDGRDYAGTYGIAQPLIAPLFGGISTIELLARVAGDRLTAGYDIVRRTFDAQHGPDEAAWRRALHDGLVVGSDATPVSPRVRVGDWIEGTKPWLRERSEQDATRLEVNFRPSPSIQDGRFANNGWLQELPEPLSKLTWDNAALMSPATAQGLGVERGDMVRLDHPLGTLEVPVEILPGQATGSITLDYGFGRRVSGSVAAGTGFDVYPMRTGSAMHRVNVTASRARGHYDLATTQEHFAIEALGQQERAERIPHLVREIDRTAYRADPEGAAGGHEHPLDQLWEEPVDYDGYRWGMSIDLNACIGCNACVVACQSENNTPVVGKSEVLRSREMHWIRIDRYFAGDPEKAAVVHQPLTCQHCENAPCEQVCPVGATMHDKDGLNVMVYNRCIGTRYCANNCPYKVRRFNYFNNHKSDSAIEAMVYNPDVTLRARGVMEKCTFCVQRIQQAKIVAKNEGRAVHDGEVTTACEQACPTRAITFGDLNAQDESGHGSRVAGKFHEPRAYGLLAEWNYRPRTRYLARLRNPNPDGGPADRG